MAEGHGPRPMALGHGFIVIGSSLICAYESLTGQGHDDAIPEGTCLHGSVTSLFRGNLDGRGHTYHGNTCQETKIICIFIVWVQV